MYTTHGYRPLLDAAFLEMQRLLLEVPLSANTKEEYRCWP